MKKYIYVFAFLSLVIATSARADDAAMRRVFEQRYAVMKTAISDRNERALAAMLTPDFVNSDVAGQTETAAQMIDEVRRLPEDPRKTSETKLLSIKVEGDNAVVEQQYDMKTSKIAANGDKKNIELQAASTDSWVKENNAWLCRKTVTHRLDYFVNGQLIAHKERAPGT